MTGWRAAIGQSFFHITDGRFALISSDEVQAQHLEQFPSVTLVGYPMRHVWFGYPQFVGYPLGFGYPQFGCRFGYLRLGYTGFLWFSYSSVFENRLGTLLQTGATAELFPVGILEAEMDGTAAVVAMEAVDWRSPEVFGYASH
jgi:hypothetical protein